MDAHEENKALRAEIELLHQKLSVFEPSTQPGLSGSGGQHETEAQRRARVRDIFNLFDRDGSGELDVAEFAVLAFQLGETFNNDETTRAVEALDTDRNGGVSFEEFFAWWDSPVRQRGSMYSSYDTGGKETHDEQLERLRLKLRSHAFMKTLSSLIHKVDSRTKLSSSGAAIKLRNSTGGVASAASTPVAGVPGGQADQGNRSFHLRFESGGSVDYSRPISGAKLSVRLDESKAREIRSREGATEETVLTKWSFVVRPDADPARLQQAVEYVRQLLDSVFGAQQRAAGAPEYAVDLVQPQQPGGEQLFTIRLGKSDPQGIVASNMVSGVQLEKCEFRTAATRLPEDPSTPCKVKQEFDLAVVFGPAVAEFAKSLPVPPAFQAASLIGSCLKQIELVARFDDLDAALKELGLSQSPPTPTRAAFKETLARALAEAERAGRIPPQMLALYDHLQGTMRGVKLVEVVFGDTVIEFDLSTADMDILPSLAEARAVQPNPGGGALV